MSVIIKNLRNGIKNVIINDPKTYNSLSYKTINELIKILKKLDKFVFKLETSKELMTIHLILKLLKKILKIN